MESICECRTRKHRRPVPTGTPLSLQQFRPLLPRSNSQRVSSPWGQALGNAKRGQGPSAKSYCPTQLPSRCWLTGPISVPSWSSLGRGMGNSCRPARNTETPGLCRVRTCQLGTGALSVRQRKTTKAQVSVLPPRSTLQLHSVEFAGLAGWAPSCWAQLVLIRRGGVAVQVI